MGQKFGGVRPWEMDLFRPREWEAVQRHHDQLMRERSADG